MTKELEKFSTYNQSRWHDFDQKMSGREASHGEVIYNTILKRIEALDNKIINSQLNDKK